MTHVYLALAALLSAALGVYIIVVTKAGSVPALVVGAAFVLFALFVMAPVQLSALREELTKAWQGYREPRRDDR
jgi:hypothetical protein